MGGQTTGRRAWGVVVGSALVLSILGRPAPAAGQEPVPLAAPTARAVEGFTHIFDVVAMNDGRVLMTDSRERALAIVDLDGGTVERIGRRGRGPKEYLSVFTILPSADGGFDVYDATQHRFLLVDAAGTVLDARPFIRPELSGFSAPYGPDAAGNLYIDVRELGDNGLRREAVVYRWDVSTGRVDSVTTILTFAPGQEGHGIIPMPVADAWSFLPDGSVARIVAEDYHVEWVGGEAGSRRGPPIPHPRIRVGEAEREAWTEELYAQPAAGGSTTGGGGGGGTAPARRAFDPGRFPDYVPPFERGYQPAAPWGEIWLKLEVASDDDRSVFDVIDREGRLARRVSVPGRARVVGFGPGSVYVARKDAFDLEWLERYAR